MKIIEKKVIAKKHKGKIGFNSFCTFFIGLIITFILLMAALSYLQINNTDIFSFLTSTISLAIAGTLSFLIAFLISSYKNSVAKMLYAIATGDEKEEFVGNKITDLDKAIREIAPEPAAPLKVSKKGIVSESDKSVAKTIVPKSNDTRPTLGCLAFKFINKSTEIEVTIKSFELERIVIPAVHNGFPVRVVKTAIEDPEAQIKTQVVVLPKSIRQIYPYTFAKLEDLVDISIPDGITKIGSSAFEGCSKLSEIFIPLSVVEIGQNAFHNCGFLTISIEPDYKPNQWDIQYKDNQTPVIYSAIRK